MKTNPSLNRSLTTLLCAATASLLILSQPAQAGYVVTLQQVGSNVVATGNGPIDLTDLSLININLPLAGGLEPSLPLIVTGPEVSGGTDHYAAVFSISGPTSFGSGVFSAPNSGSGDLVGIFNPTSFSGLVIVPHDYVSGTLSDSSTYLNATFSSLGVTPGTYVWTWGTGANQNFTLQIPTAGVPDSGSTLGLFLLSLIGLFGLNRLRQSQLA
jgi:hypothetical protein